MGLLDRLTEGNEEDENNKYNVYVQFDGDDPMILALDIDNEDDFNIVLHPEDNHFVLIKDAASGKQLKIFAIKQKDEKKNSK